LSRDELTVSDVYEALQSREKMKGMVHSDVPSSKGDALQVRGRPEQRSSNDGSDRYKSQESRRRSKSRPPKKFCKYCRKKTHFVEE
jgi:ribosomal protein L33